MWLAILYLVLGCAVLAWSSDRFVMGSVQLARNLAISPLIVGVVFVGFGTSLPEMLVSIVAALHGKADIALGNALGSYIINIALVLGLSALVAPIVVRNCLLKREFPLLALSLILVYLLLADGFLGFWDGVILLLSFLGFLGVLFFIAWKYSDKKHVLLEESCEKTGASVSSVRAFFTVCLGFTLLLISSRVMVLSATFIAHALGMSDLIIGLTIVGIGTSLPELAASVASVLRSEHDIALGNVIGSNMLGILSVTAMPAILSPGVIPSGVLYRDLPMMVIATLLLFALCFPKTESGYRIQRWKGGVLLGYFILYLAMLYPVFHVQ